MHDSRQESSSSKIVKNGHKFVTIHPLKTKVDNEPKIYIASPQYIQVCKPAPRSKKVTSNISKNFFCREK